MSHVQINVGMKACMLPNHAMAKLKLKPLWMFGFKLKKKKKDKCIVDVVMYVILQIPKF